MFDNVILVMIMFAVLLKTVTGFLNEIRKWKKLIKKLIRKIFKSMK